MKETNTDKRFFILLSLIFVLNLIQAYATPVSEDEAYYWVWSQYPAWGYFDHPPMVAWWNFIGNSIFNCTLGVRFFGILMNCAGLFFLWKTLNPKSDKQFWLFASLVLATLVFQIFGFISSPDSPLLFFSLLYLYAFRTFLERNSVLNTIVFSVALAGLMYSKYQGLLLIVFTIVPVLSVLIKNPNFYFSVLLSLVLYIPHFIWLFQHDFVPIHYHFIDRSYDNSFEADRLIIYPLIYFVGMSPLLSYFSAKSLFSFKPKSHFERSLWWLAVLPGVFFFFSLFKESVQPQWLLISFLAMMMICYIYYADKPDEWLLRLGFISFGIIVLIRIGLMLPSVSPLYKNLNFAEEVGKRNIQPVVFEKYQEASLFLFYNRDKTAAVHRTLGNRDNQYTLWDWEDKLYKKTIYYVSPWVSADDSFRSFKNRDYFIKEIADYNTFCKVKVQTAENIKTKANETVELKLEIFNGHAHSLQIGGQSDLRLNVNYYLDKQYNVVYASELAVEEFTLAPGEHKTLNVIFKNIEKTGDFKAAVGVYYSELGTTYVSGPIDLVSF